MDRPTVKSLSVEAAEQLFEFEVKNRKYFETIGLGRSSSYYDRAAFQSILEELVAEQEKGLHYMYLVFNEKDEVIGRVNLTEVIRGPLNKAELGYRIDQSCQGKGIATEAVRQVLIEASVSHKLHRVEAGTSPQNIGSQIVLIKNGFQNVGKFNQYIFQNNEWQDSLIFEKILD